MMHWLAKLHSFNPRWLYLATILFLLIPFLWDIPMPQSSISAASLDLYNTIEACPKNGIILIDSSWDPGSQAENKSQLQCVIRHLCSRKIRFVVISTVTAVGPQFANSTIGPIAEAAGYQYGTDWVNLGYIQPAAGMPILIEGMLHDLHQLRKEDYSGTPVDQLPLMKKVKTLRDVYMVYSVTYAPDQSWISFVKGQTGIPVAFGYMTIMAPTYSPFLDSKQLCGALVGNRGAAEYEALCQQPDLGTKLSMAGSFGNIAVILAAIVGNIGLWAALKTRK